MPNGRDDPQTLSWHVDRRVPLALLWTIGGAALTQLATILIWGTMLTGRVTVLETVVAQRSPIVERFIQTESDVRTLRLDTSHRLDRIENKLDRLIENGVPARRLPDRP